MNDPANSSDEELLDSLSTSNDEAIAALVERHARSLHDFLLRLTLDGDAASEITRDTFAYILANASQRPDEISARAWLYNFALDRGLEAADDRDRPSTARLSTGDRRFTVVDEDIDREAALWAWEAARSLRPRDYALLDTTLRRELSPEHLSGSVAPGRGGVYSALRRARGAFDEAYVATALYFRGREACEELAELVGGSGAAMRVGIRRQIASHMEDCDKCQATLDSVAVAVDVFAELRNVELPQGLLDDAITAAVAAGSPTAAQLSLDQAAESEEELEADEATSEWGQDDEEEVVAPDGAEAWDDEEGEAREPDGAPAGSASEEQLWARPPEFAGAMASELPELVSEIESRYGVDRTYRPYEETEAYEHAGSEYAREPYRGIYAPAPLTLGERLSSWFAPAYGRGFLWSYALLGVATAIAVYIGIAVADSLSGGGAGDVAAIGDDEVREIACESSPLSVESGANRVFEFDPGGLNGFEMGRVAVTERPASVSESALTVEVASPTALTAEAGSVFSLTAQELQFALQILWQRDGEDAVTDCALVVNVPAAAGPAPTSEAGETPQAGQTPENESTPTP